MLDRFETDRLIGEALRDGRGNEVHWMAEAPSAEGRPARRMVHVVWLIREKETGRTVGRAGLRPVFLEGQYSVEIFYRLESDWWNKGFATEAAAAVTDLGLHVLQLPELVAITRETNPASIRVLEKVGYVFDRDVIHDSIPQVIYRAERASVLPSEDALASRFGELGEAGEPS